MPSNNRSFRFAVAPTLGGDRDAAHYDVVRTYLALALEREVTIVIPDSYEDVFDRLRRGDVDAAMVGEVASKRGAERGDIEYLVAPTQDDTQAQTYTSAFVTAPGSRIAAIADLRGCRMAMVDTQSTSGYIVPRAMLREHGIDPDRDLTIDLLGTHRAVGEAVAAGAVDAGAGHERLVTSGYDLRVLARSRPIPNGPLVVRSALGAKLRARLAEALLVVHERDPAAARSLLRQGNRFTPTPTRGNATLKSIAALAGVSYATVSRVVNETGYVAAETAQRVRAIVDEYGYAPNGHSRVLLGRIAAMVGVVPAASYHPAALQPLLEAFRRAQVPAVICPVVGSLAESLYPEMLRDRRLGTLLVDVSWSGDGSVAALQAAGLDLRLLDLARLDPSDLDRIVAPLATAAVPA